MIVITEKPTGQLIIVENYAARQVEVHISSKTPTKVTVMSSVEVRVTKTYQKSRKKSKGLDFKNW